ncbi:MAG: hypothetical protein KDD82_20970 [Planctomycetes bacterium]|nr:hypothetical protein [Planctomycetota bacterium]
MIAGVLGVYARPALFDGSSSLEGLDYPQLHQGRIEYAQAALAEGRLPEWYPREFLGAPFRANLQSFPWIPTRFVLYLVSGPTAFALGAILSAVLAAWFTWLYCLGRMSPWAAAVAGWTFACSGYFAARVFVGHLPLLEAYPALPLLAWLVERSAARPTRPALCALALATAAVCLAGHPQLPSYAVGVALIVALRRDHRRATLGAIGCGVGLSLFGWIPCLALIQRSSRVAMERAAQFNDIPLPWGRVLAFVSPWRDGQPTRLDPGSAFRGYPHDGFFWDTTCYVGLLPLVAAVVLGVGAWRRRTQPDAKLPGWLAELALLGALALVLALPWVQVVRDAIPVTIFRSPARQLYVTLFALACAAGFGVQRAHAWLPSRWSFLVLVAVALHGLDLGAHARHFVRVVPREARLPSHLRVSPQRVACDNFVGAFIRENDRVGGFDSLILSKTWLALRDLCDLWELPEQYVFTGRADLQVLEALGVRFLTTLGPRPEAELQLMQRGGGGDVHLYHVAAPPQSKVRLYPWATVSLCPDEDALRAAREQGFGPRLTLLESPELRSPPTTEPAADGAPGPLEVPYRRPTSESFVIEVDAGEGGVLRVMESYDQGWSVSLDGAPAPLLAGDDFTLAVELPPGPHTVVFAYSTPGKWLGNAGSLLALALGLLALSRLPAPPQPTEDDAPTPESRELAAGARAG